MHWLRVTVGCTSIGKFCIIVLYIFRLKVFGIEIFGGKRRDRVGKSRLNGDPMKKTRFSAIRAKSPLINREVDNKNSGKTAN